MSELRRLQETELEILVEINRVCKLLDVEYFLDCGTALGAVRHKGFIPWDDDIDIGMMRRDYNKFLEKAPSLLADKFYLENPDKDENCTGLIAKVRNKNTVFKEISNENATCQGIFVDIFPFDVIPNDASSRKKAIKCAQLLRWMHIIRNVAGRPVAEGRSLLWRAEEAALRITHPLFCVFPKKYFKNKMDKYICQWDDKGCEWLTCHFDTEPISMKTDDFFPLKLCEFEGGQYPIMKNTHEYLTQMYNNYMELPPENQRITHMPEYIKFEE